jgi:hypothetical protein
MLLVLKNKKKKKKKLALQATQVGLWSFRKNRIHGTHGQPTGERLVRPLGFCERPGGPGLCEDSS